MREAIFVYKMLYAFPLLLYFSETEPATSYLSSFHTMSSAHTSGDQFRDYQDDRAAKSQDTIYTTANGVYFLLPCFHLNTNLIPRSPCRTPMKLNAWEKTVLSSCKTST